MCMVQQSKRNEAAGDVCWGVCARAGHARLHSVRPAKARKGCCQLVKVPPTAYDSPEIKKSLLASSGRAAAKARRKHPRECETARSCDPDHAATMRLAETPCTLPDCTLLVSFPPVCAEQAPGSHPQRTPAGTAACHQPPASPLTHHHAGPARRPQNIGPQASRIWDDETRHRCHGASKRADPVAACWSAAGCLIWPVCGTAGAAYVAPGKACVDGLVNVDDVGVDIPAVGVV